MTTAIFDAKDLNSLFDNQKKLDDLFDSIFDDDNFIIYGAVATSTVISSPNSSVPHPSSTNVMPTKSYLLSISEGNPYIFLIPIALEIAAIYFVATNLG